MGVKRGGSVSYAGYVREHGEAQTEFGESAPSPWTRFSLFLSKSSSNGDFEPLPCKYL